MNSINKICIRKAFSFIEILIVLVVISVILAAIAPIITKKLASHGLTLPSVGNFSIPDDKNLSINCSKVPNCKLCLISKTNSNDVTCLYCTNTYTGTPDCQRIYAPDCSCRACPENATCEDGIVKCNAGYSYITKDDVCAQCSDTNYGGTSNCTSCTTFNDTLECKRCSRGFYLSNGICTECETGYACNGTENKIACTRDDENCNECTINDNDEFVCTQCSGGLAPSGTGCFSDSAYMKLPELGIYMTKFNAGDHANLTLSASITQLNPDNDFCPDASPCCFVFPSNYDYSTTSCDSANGNYSGCGRTVCNGYAANIFCSSLTLDGKSWALPTNALIQEFHQQYPTNHMSYGLGNNGLQFCRAGGSPGGAASCYYPDGSTIRQTNGMCSLNNSIILQDFYSASFPNGSLNIHRQSVYYTCYNGGVRCVAPICASNQYYSATNDTCKPCPAHSTCSTNNFTCDVGYYKNNDECSSCSSAISGCASCSDSNACTVCNTGYYKNSSNGCTSCTSLDPNCTACSNSTTCTACSGGLTANGSSCISSSSNTCSAYTTVDTCKAHSGCAYFTVTSSCVSCDYLNANATYSQYCNSMSNNCNCPADTCTLLSGASNCTAQAGCMYNGIACYSCSSGMGQYYVNAGYCNYSPANCNCSSSVDCSSYTTADECSAHSNQCAVEETYGYGFSCMDCGGHIPGCANYGYNCVNCAVCKQGYALGDDGVCVACPSACPNNCTWSMGTTYCN